MRPILIVIFCSLLALAACKRDVPELEGKAATAAFTFQIIRSPGGDTLPFSNKVSFTNTSTDAFSYLWEFGDANTSVLANPVHSYLSGSSFTVKLTSVGPRGTNTTSQVVSFDSPCEYDPFVLLSGCSNKKWALSPVADAIAILAGNGIDVESTAAGATCMVDDEYTFNIGGGLNYDSKGQTFFSEGTPPACIAGRANAKTYVMLRGGSGVNPRLVLSSNDLDSHPFIGPTTKVVDNTYEVLAITEDDMTLQGTLANGKKLRIKMANASVSTNSIRFFISGGSRKTWKLDPTAGANPITAGTEGNPTEYFGGGPLADCQIDDWYTFTATDSVYVNFNGNALIYGGPGDYNCGDYGNFAGAYALGPVQGTGTGSAQMVLANGADHFIGVMDRVQNVYRILEVTSNRLVIRVGNGTGTVQTLKFVNKD